MNVLQEVAKIEAECKSLGIVPSKFCVDVGVKAGLLTSWKARAKKEGSKYQPRESIHKKMCAKLAELKQQKLDNAGLKQVPIPRIPIPQPEFSFDDETAKAVLQQTNHRPSACEVLTEIVMGKVRGMSLVQLAMLIGHLEAGNGK